MVVLLLVLFKLVTWKGHIPSSSSVSFALLKDASPETETKGEKIVEEEVEEGKKEEEKERRKENKWISK